MHQIPKFVFTLTFLCLSWANLQAQDCCRQFFAYFELEKLDPDSLEIDFYNASEGFVEFISWDFGDGGSSADDEPSHTYANAGNYRICLTVSNSLGCTSTFCKEIHAGTGPDECENLESYFEAEVYADELSAEFFSLPEGNPVSFLWSFGDGTETTEEDPFYDYNQAGIFEVCHAVTNSAGCVSSLCAPVCVDDPDLCVDFEADFSFSAGGFNPLVIDFVSNAPDSTTNYFWTFGDDSSSLEENPMHSYAQPGVYEVCLIASGDDCIANVCKTVEVNQATQNCSTLAASFDYLVNFFNGTVEFTEEATDATVWSWDFDDGTGSNERNPVHLYDGNGDYDVCLTVTSELACTARSCRPVHLPVYLELVVSIPEHIEAEAAFSIYPNPATTQFKIDFFSGTEILSEIEIRTLTGQLVLKRALESAVVDLRELSAIPSGMYILTALDSQGQSYSQRLQLAR